MPFPPFLSLRRRSSSSLFDETTSPELRSQLSPPIIPIVSPNSESLNRWREFYTQQVSPLKGKHQDHSSTFCLVVVVVHSLLLFLLLSCGVCCYAVVEPVGGGLPFAFPKEALAPVDRMEKKIMSGQFTEF